MPADLAIVKLQRLLLSVENGHICVHDSLIHINDALMALIRVNVDLRIANRSNQVAVNWVTNAHQVCQLTGNGSILHSQILDETVKLVTKLEAIFIADLSDRYKLL